MGKEVRSLWLRALWQAMCFLSQHLHLRTALGTSDSVTLWGLLGLPGYSLQMEQNHFSSVFYLEFQVKISAEEKV